MLSRELFWGIQYGWLTYLLALLTLAVLAHLWRLKVKEWRNGKDEGADLDWRGKVCKTLGHLIGQRLLGEKKAVGIAHLLVFYGFVVLFIGTVLLMLDSHLDQHFLKGYIFVSYKLILNIFGLLALAGITGLIFRRYILMKAPGESDGQNFLTLVLPFLVLLTGFLVEGSRLAIAVEDNPGWQFWAFPVYPVVEFMRSTNLASLGWIHTLFWWVHMVLAFTMITALGWTNLSHILSVPLNLFYQAWQQPGRLREINLAEKDFGVSGLKDFTRTQLISVEACVNAGRCEMNCPAFNSNKPLSPRALMMAMKQYGDTESPLVGKQINEEALWACTTCGACQKKCPVLANPVEKIIDLRRYQVMALGSLPPGLQAPMLSLQKRGHPWSGANLSRLDWARGLDVPLAAKKKEFDVLFWVGCTGALVERNIKVSRTIVELLRHCRVDFAILGQEESCTCHMARRLGNEYLYQMNAKKNIARLQQYTFKTIITACPHCYHTLKNEYSLEQEGLQVVSHVVFFRDLIKRDLLQLKQNSGKKLTYHDPCYYGRINQIFDAPRELCTLVDGSLVEAAKSREEAFCCGGGGGGIWQDDKSGDRINELRVKQLLENNVERIATSCPFCMQMLESALSSVGRGEVVVRDVAELLMEQLKDR